MEPEGEWSYLNYGMYSSNEEEADFMAQLLGNCSLQDDLASASIFEDPSTLWPGHESTVKMTGPNNTDTNMYRYYSGGTSMFFPNSSQESYNPSNFNQILATNASDCCTRDMKNTMEKEETKILVTDLSPQDTFNNLFENCKKRSHDLANVKKKRNVKQKKASRSSFNTAIHRPSSSSHWSENDSNGSWELNIEMNSSLIRAGKG